MTCLAEEAISSTIAALKSNELVQQFNYDPGDALLLCRNLVTLSVALGRRCADSGSSSFMPIGPG